MKNNIYIGCSGFYHPDWNGVLYPQNTLPQDYLELYAQQLNAVEINLTFYRKPQVGTLKKWYDDTPSDFKFFIKMPKNITHEKKLQRSKKDIVEFCDYIQQHLGEKLGGFLYQLPPSFDFNLSNLDIILNQIDLSKQNTIEFRHASWWRSDVVKLLNNKGITFSGISFPRDIPDDFINNDSTYNYYRLHGNPILYKSEYNHAFLDHLSENIKNTCQETYIFFNNTWGTAAIHNSLYLNQIIKSNYEEIGGVIGSGN